MDVLESTNLLVPAKRFSAKTQFQTESQLHTVTVKTQKVPHLKYHKRIAMRLIHIASLTIIGLANAGDPYCGGGTFTDGTGECKFICSDQTYIDIEDLTFDMIKDNCGNVAAAAAINDNCNSLEDLVYTQDECQCPYCKCSGDMVWETTEISRYHSGDGLANPSKQCYNCTCVDWTAVSSIESKINWCYQTTQAQDPDDFDLYKCPSAKCEANRYNGTDIVYGGTYWAEDVDEGEMCETLCYCDGTDGKICKTGWENIVDDDKMVNWLRDDCQYGAGAVK